MNLKFEISSLKLYKLLLDLNTFRDAYALKIKIDLMLQCKIIGETNFAIFADRQCKIIERQVCDSVPSQECQLVPKVSRVYNNI